MVSGQQSRPASPRQPGPSAQLHFSEGADPERLLLEAAALRRRQLGAAFLHGSGRSWRVRRRIWPAVLAGTLIVALAVAAVAVAAAFSRQQELQRAQQQPVPAVTAPSTPQPPDG